MSVPGAAPEGDALRQAALAYLARFASSEAGLARVLERRIARWARRALDSGAEPGGVRSDQEQARGMIPALVADLARIGAVSDAGFAETRVRALERGGRSRRAIAAHLAARGIDAEATARALQTVRAAAPDDEAQTELAAALLQARRRRLGPFATCQDAVEPDDARQQRDRALGVLARAGFAQDVAQQALETDRDTAETLIARLRGN